MTHLHPLTEDDGFMFAATGPKYRSLARRAALSLRRVMGAVQIDLFTDVAFEDPVFDQVHLVEHRGKRPKMEALRKSRFERTLYLDCDVVVIADCSDVFALLRVFDLVGAHDMYGNSPVSLNNNPAGHPAAFRQINGGVMGLRRSARSDAFLSDWDRAFHDQGIGLDQPSLRDLLWSTDLRFWVLPPEYNFMHTRLVRAYGPAMAAPRILHVPRLHKWEQAVLEQNEPIDLAKLLNLLALQGLHEKLVQDQSLAGARTLAPELAEWIAAYPRAQS